MVYQSLIFWKKFNTFQTFDPITDSFQFSRLQQSYTKHPYLHLQYSDCILNQQELK